MRKRRIVFGARMSLRKVIIQMQDGKDSLEKDGEYTDRRFNKKWKLQKAFGQSFQGIPRRPWCEGCNKVL